MRPLTPDAALRAIPLGWYDGCRTLAARLPRGNPVRNALVLTLKRAARAWRGQMAGSIDSVQPPDWPGISFEPTDSMVMEIVYWFGVRGYEGTVPKVWVSLCRRADGILEIGGNVGLFSVIGAGAATCPYTVVEPLPEIAAVLRANLRRNGLQDRVAVRQAAVIPHAPARDVVLNIPSENRAAPVGAHLVEGVEVSGRSTDRRLTVPGIPIRDLLAGRTLIKIDAEGIEAELVTAAWDMLLHDRPDLLIEVLPEARHLGEVLARLAQAAGYRVFALPEYGRDSIVEVDPAHFTADVPGRYHAKDVVLTTRPPEGLAVDSPRLN
jgi:FkbM family methyltransferase